MLGENGNRVPDDAPGLGYELMDGGETCFVQDFLKCGDDDSDMKKVIPPPDTTRSAFEGSRLRESGAHHVLAVQRSSPRGKI